MNTNKCQHGGFSLVEVLMVLGIIAILGALLLPVGRSLRSRLEQTQCLSNLRKIGGAVHLYAQDHQRQLPGPAPGQVYAYYGVGNFSDPRAASHFLLEYLGYQKPPTGTPARMMDEFTCPAAKKIVVGDDEIYGRHYGQFPSKYQGVPTIPDPVNPDRALYPFGYKSGVATVQAPPRMEQVPRPSRAVAFSDRWGLPTRNGSALAHGDRRNFLFLDGHVRTVPQEEMVSNTEIGSW